MTINEEFFQGHFPGNPTMPGVLIIEALAQVGSILILKWINLKVKQPILAVSTKPNSVKSGPW